MFLQNDKTQKKRNTSWVAVEEKQGEILNLQFKATKVKYWTILTSMLISQMNKISHASKYILNKLNSFEIGTKYYFIQNMYTKTGVFSSST